MGTNCSRSCGRFCAEPMKCWQAYSYKGLPYLCGQIGMLFVGIVLLVLGIVFTSESSYYSIHPLKDYNQRAKEWNSWRSDQWRDSFTSDSIGWQEEESTYNTNSIDPLLPNGKEEELPFDKQKNYSKNDFETFQSFKYSSYDLFKDEIYTEIHTNEWYINAPSDPDSYWGDFSFKPFRTISYLCRDPAFVQGMKVSGYDCLSFCGAVGGSFKNEACTVPFKVSEICLVGNIYGYIINNEYGSPSSCGDETVSLIDLQGTDKLPFVIESRFQGEGVSYVSYSDRLSRVDLSSTVVHFRSQFDPYVWFYSRTDSNGNLLPTKYDSPIALWIIFIIIGSISIISCIIRHHKLVKGHISEVDYSSLVEEADIKHPNSLNSTVDVPGSLPPSSSTMAPTSTYDDESSNSKYEPPPSYDEMKKPIHGDIVGEEDENL